MKKHIPNALTCCNLISGCIAITYALGGWMGAALTFIIVGAIFDFFDGMVARLLHVSSPIGKELDSLADVVTFGVAPSMMLTMWAMFCRPEGLPFWVCFIPLLMAAFSALRLAKFNLDERQTMGFIGLPTPANALFWASLLTTWGADLRQYPASLPILFVLMLLSCYLLVSEIPMFALKFKTWGWHGNEVKWIFLAVCIPLIAVFGWGGLAMSIAWYLVLSVITSRKEPTTPTTHNS